MKNTFKAFVASVAVLVMSGTAFGQPHTPVNTYSGNASVKSRIIQPIWIQNAQGLAFGNVLTSATAGTAVVLAAAAPGETFTAGAAAYVGTAPDPHFYTSVAAAKFNVTGEPGFVYDITNNLSGNAITVSDGAGHTMGVVVTNPDLGLQPTLPAGGAQAFYIGGTLSVGANQTSGEYNTTNTGGSGTWTETVTYH